MKNIVLKFYMFLESRALTLEISAFLFANNTTIFYLFLLILFSLYFSHKIAKVSVNEEQYQNEIQ